MEETEKTEGEKLAVKLFNAEKRKAVRQKRRGERAEEVDHLSAFPQTTALLRYSKDYRTKAGKAEEVYRRATKRAWDNVSREAFDLAWGLKNKAGQVLLDFILSPACEELDE